MTASKRCPKCGKNKDTSDFYANRGKKDGLSSWCKDCMKTKNYEWRRNHRSRVNAASRRQYAENRALKLGRQRGYLRKLKMDTINAYGGKCACCGENNIEFLCIDHVNGGGGKERAELRRKRFYVELRRRGYPKDEYRVLCSNCNTSIGLYGYCPHQTRARVLGFYLDYSIGIPRLPERFHDGDAGLDLYVSRTAVIPPHSFVDVHTDVYAQFPSGTFGRITGRSSAIRKLGVLVQEGVLDEGYTGELFCGVFNLGSSPITLQPGDRVAQLIMHPRLSVELEVLPAPPESVDGRGGDGFGSTDRQHKKETHDENSSG